MFKILMRKKEVVITDPQRRCYNGCLFSSVLQWTDWEVLDSTPDAASADRRLTFWKELNDYAVSQRGESARSEFKIMQ